MRAAHFADHAMRPQPGQGACHTPALPPLFGGVSFPRIQGRPHVPVPHPTHRPLAPAEDFQQGRIRFGPRVEGAITAAVLHDRTADRPHHRADAFARPHTGQRCQITAVGRFTDLCPPVQVAHALAQDLPFLLPLRVAFVGAIDPELVRTVGRPGPTCLSCPHIPSHPEIRQTSDGRGRGMK